MGNLLKIQLVIFLLLMVVGSIPMTAGAAPTFSAQVAPYNATPTSNHSYVISRGVYPPGLNRGYYHRFYVYTADMKPCPANMMGYFNVAPYQFGDESTVYTTGEVVIGSYGLYGYNDFTLYWDSSSNRYTIDVWGAQYVNNGSSWYFRNLPVQWVAYCIANPSSAAYINYPYYH